MPLTLLDGNWDLLFRMSLGPRANQRDHRQNRTRHPGQNTRIDAHSLETMMTELGRNGGFATAGLSK
jgi:hypothetical protein